MDYTGKKAAFFTLGCKLNFSETSTIARHFETMGFERVDFKEQADVYVVNSCSVTAESDKKSRNIIRQAIRRNPKAVVAVTGCRITSYNVCYTKLLRVLLIISRGELSSLLQLHFNRGDVLVFIAALLWAFYSANLKRYSYNFV